MLTRFSYGYLPDTALCGGTNADTSLRHQCTAPAGATTFSHDASGNLTGSSAGLAVGYNTKGQTTSMTNLTGGGALSMSYAGTNQF